MSVMLDEIKVNEFCNLIFQTIDTLGHLPISLRSKESTPTKLEKYPRLFFGYLQRYEDPKIAFSEWESKLLRDTPGDESNYKKEKYFPVLQSLEKWIDKNPEFFQGKSKKVLIQHLRGSLYARIFGYLYPRRELSMIAVDLLKDKAKDINYGIENFENIIEGDERVKDLQIKFSNDEWENIVKDAKRKFIDAKKYYENVLNEKPTENVEEVNNNE
ncbi:MAG: hypothetical protein PWQ60_726 [Thermoanaerobacteraceae bacterium]|nr:hypothetical protein [Thermoanaerobacteraceae bacterium]